MPGRNQYPSGADLLAFLEAAGFSSSLTTDAAFMGGDADLELFAVAGWRAFNQAAGRQMLAVAGSRSFDRPSGMRGVIDLGDDLASGSVTAPALTDLGTALVLNTDYVLEPLDAAGRGAPYNRLRFWRRVWNYSQTIGPPITVTGSWGYATTIPEDAWVGMLAMGALALFPLIQQARTQGFASWKEADMDEAYGPMPLAGLQMGWQMRALATCGGLDDKGKRIAGTYTRVTVG